MKSKSSRAALAAALFLIFGTAIPATATTIESPAVPMPYVAAFTPSFGNQGVPYSGKMQITINDGYVTGTYTGTSVRPDALNGRIVPITGTVDRSSDNVHFKIGGALSFTGQLFADGTISGTADYYGRLYEFMAKPG
jgi:hypothetical protein